MPKVAPVVPRVRLQMAARPGRALLGTWGPIAGRLRVTWDRVPVPSDGCHVRRGDGLRWLPAEGPQAGEGPRLEPTVGGGGGTAQVSRPMREGLNMCGLVQPCTVRCNASAFPSVGDPTFMTWLAKIRRCGSSGTASSTRYAGIERRGGRYTTRTKLGSTQTGRLTAAEMTAVPTLHSRCRLARAHESSSRMLDRARTDLSTALHGFSLAARSRLTTLRNEFCLMAAVARGFGTTKDPGRRPRHQSGSLPSRT